MSEITRTQFGICIEVPSAVEFKGVPHPGYFITRQSLPEPEAIGIVIDRSKGDLIVFPSQDWEAIKQAVDSLIEAEID